MLKIMEHAEERVRKIPNELEEKLMDFLSSEGAPLKLMVAVAGIATLALVGGVISAAVRQ